MKFAKKTGILVLLCSILNVANSQEFRFVSSQESGIDFRNQVKVDRELNFLIYETVYNGGGVAIGDINNDDLPDLYFSGNQVSDRLYLTWEI